MKLSEAILLGSTVLAPKAGQQHYSELNAGCALGMAAVANGCTFRPATGPYEEKDRRTLGAETVWGNWVLTTVNRPCSCWRLRVPRMMRIKDIIAHLFDYHIMTRKNWTMEQLVAWVETVEPKESVSPDNADENRVSRTLHNWQTLPQPGAQPSQEELDDWQEVRRTFASKSYDERRRARVGL